MKNNSNKSAILLLSSNFVADILTENIDTNEITNLYSEFGEEDQRLAEEQLDEYAKLLKQENQE
ncbi:hypothetical protein [Halotia branconii]|uniref:Uncharacterized protein n=1 Tax=Halotia branconii CENA392 TaxID=1539056 RepID=A0AAJ6NW91_9CYAN|nr:hypothetical protein [Halotia branconii]WGV27904.1 hypothetical protein QI031_10655 [Halotia branconii CENA392]